MRYTRDGVGANTAGAKTRKERGAMGGGIGGGHSELRKGAEGSSGR